MDDVSPPRDRPQDGAEQLLEIEVEVDGSSARVIPVGEIDLATAPELETVLGAAADSEGIRSVVVDLAGVTFIDSSGIHVLCKAANGARRDGYDFGVARPRTHIRRLFVMAGIEQLLPVIDR